VAANKTARTTIGPWLFAGFAYPRYPGYNDPAREQIRRTEHIVIDLCGDREFDVCHHSPGWNGAGHDTVIASARYMVIKSVSDAGKDTARLISLPSPGAKRLPINPAIATQEMLVTNGSIIIGVFVYRNIQFYIDAVAITPYEGVNVCSRRVLRVASTLIRHTQAYAARLAAGRHA
jgi:hypothetical protein